MSSTVNGYGRPMIGSVVKKESRGGMRGQSLNYSKKNNSNVLMETNNRNTKYQESTRAEKRETSQLANQFLTFKLENPKIVTIKKWVIHLDLILTDASTLLSYHLLLQGNTGVGNCCTEVFVFMMRGLGILVTWFNCSDCDVHCQPIVVELCIFAIYLWLFDLLL